MRTFTVKPNTRSFTVKCNKRILTAQDENRTEYRPGDPSTWVIVGSPNVTLADIVGTLGDNIIP